jgi:hypothetical protein
MPKVKLFLLYSYENIEHLRHEDIIPLKLDQSVYFESTAFRMLKYSDLPKCDAIGFITPKSFNNLLLSTDFNTFMNHTLQVEIKEIIPIFHFPGHTLNHGIQSHGPDFKTIWKYLSENVGYGTDYDFDEVPVFFRNAWVAPRSQVVGFLYFAKECMRVLDAAPPNIEELLYSDANYMYATLDKNTLLRKFGVPHYTFHPFIMEYAICIYKYMTEGDGAKN